MTVIISRITVAEAATIINAIITFVQVTTSLSLVLLLIHFMPKSNTALSWSSISRILHSSSWPSILRADSGSNKASGFVVASISGLATLTSILIAVAGVVLPLGLSEGPPVPSSYRQVDARYVPDTSPFALVTTPNRASFLYGRQCGTMEPLACPGNGDNPNITTIAPSTLEIFNSTSHGPFTIQYRQFANGSGKVNGSVGADAVAETLVLRNDTFAVEGLIVDMSSEHPGIGFWNQSFPDVAKGTTWSQDVLWLEPVTQCVDTNLTVDYFMSVRPDDIFRDFNITDLGGFTNLTRQPPSLDRDGQNINLLQHAYKGAAYSNLFTMQFLNATRESSFIGAQYPSNSSNSISFGLNSPAAVRLSPLNASETPDLNTICIGYGGRDIANITNVHVECGLFLGPPQRLDGRDPRIVSRGSRWRQQLHACSSATRASIQRLTFSTNDTRSLPNLKISRQPSNFTALWATEKVNMSMIDIDLFWGRVDDRYENDPSLWTVRSDGFYLPAGRSSLAMFAGLPAGLPGVAHAYAWYKAYDSLGLGLYSGGRDYAIKAKFQSLVQQDPALGQAQIRNLMWTDSMASFLAVGSQSNSSLWAAESQRTIAYDFRYAIPGLLLLLIWAPSLLVAAFIFLGRKLTSERMREVFNHASVGRILVGESALRIQRHEMMVLNNGPSASVVNLGAGRNEQSHRRNKSDWANAGGSVLVRLELDRGNVYGEDTKLMSPGLY